jgi:hypothetical protein
MAAPQGLQDLRLFLHSCRIDHAWLRTVLVQYLGDNGQSDGNIFDDHHVWEFRNTVNEFTKLLDEDPENLDNDDEPED